MFNEKGMTVLWRVILIGGVSILVAGAVYLGVAKPPLYYSVIHKINSILTPGSYGGNLTPARDLRGTWISSLSGKGLQLYGLFNTPGATTTIYEDGDIELQIEKVEGNTATGQIRFFNLCGYGETQVPGYGTIKVPPVCVKDSGFSPISIRVSASALDFGTVNNNGVTATMQGSFTTDLMSGTMTMTTEWGVVKGEFHLNRKK